MDQVRRESETLPGGRLAETLLGDARRLPHTDDSQDVVLLLGPLYHLTDHAIEALGDASAEVRQLLEKQLELVRELQARIEEGREERNRRVEMLKTLALHLTWLRARAAETPGEVPSVSERVRALCDEIGGQALALAEARAAAGQRNPVRGSARPARTSSGPGASS